MDAIISMENPLTAPQFSTYFCLNHPTSAVHDCLNQFFSFLNAFPIHLASLFYAFMVRRVFRS
jgi:hypothetical protein